MFVITEEEIRTLKLTPQQKAQAYEQWGNTDLPKADQLREFKRGLIEDAKRARARQPEPAPKAPAPAAPVAFKERRPEYKPTEPGGAKYEMKFDTQKDRINSAIHLINSMQQASWDLEAEAPNADRLLRYTQRRRNADQLVMMHVLAEVLELFASAREKREALERRIEELERCPLDYRGVFTEGETYPARSICSFNGSMWFTKTETRARPGEGRDWTLVVKAGRDARREKP